MRTRVRVRVRRRAQRPLRSYAAAYFAATGATVGFLSSLTGFGAGLMLTTALSVCSDGLVHREHKWSQKAAVATSLCALSLPNLVQSGVHYRLRTMNRPIAAGLVLGSVLGAPLGLVVANRTDDTALRCLFGLFLVVTGARALRR